MFKKSILGLVVLAFLSGTVALATPNLDEKAELQRKTELIRTFQEANKDLSETEYKQRKQEFMELEGITAVEFLLGLYEMGQLPDELFVASNTTHIFAKKIETFIDIDKLLQRTFRYQKRLDNYTTAITNHYLTLSQFELKVEIAQLVLKFSDPKSDIHGFDIVQKGAVLAEYVFAVALYLEKDGDITDLLSGESLFSSIPESFLTEDVIEEAILMIGWIRFGEISVTGYLEYNSLIKSEIQRVKTKIDLEQVTSEERSSLVEELNALREAKKKCEVRMDLLQGTNTIKLDEVLYQFTKQLQGLVTPEAEPTQKDSEETQMDGLRRKLPNGNFRTIEKMEEGTEEKPKEVGINNGPFAPYNGLNSKNLLGAFAASYPNAPVMSPNGYHESLRSYYTNFYSHQYPTFDYQRNPFTGNTNMGGIFGIRQK
ncbi:MAG TPA: hypothetical protein VJB34_09500 [Bdellovibrionota bacterium]|nr:hypothetical protein [Bdellovibrionota bacterium]